MVIGDLRLRQMHRVEHRGVLAAFHPLGTADSYAREPFAGRKALQLTPKLSSVLPRSADNVYHV